MDLDLPVSMGRFCAGMNLHTSMNNLPLGTELGTVRGCEIESRQRWRAVVKRLWLPLR